MTSRNKGIAISIVTIVLVVASMWLVSDYATRNERDGKARIFSGNYPALLAACRQLIQNSSTFTNEWTESWRPDGAIFIPRDSAQFSNSVPKAIQDLRPHYVMITRNYVMVYVALPPRALLYGYTEGAEESGTVKLMDGLWYSDGERNQNTN